MSKIDKWYTYKKQSEMYTNVNVDRKDKKANDNFQEKIAENSSIFTNIF